jgi:bacteriocin biosynthesis cyclodehydratase domain-containing protein
MALKLDPRWPLVWRNPYSVQLGVDPPLVRVDNLSDIDERMLAALTVGVSMSGLALICRGRVAERDELLNRLAPALLVDETSAALPLVAVTGSGAIVDELSRVLAGSGVRVVVAENPDDLDRSAPDLAIAVGDFVLPPALHSLWLRRDIPHLPVVVSDTGVTVGPMIEPGDGPCLLCLELHRRDDDPAWPAVASQLLGRRSGVATPLVAAETAAIVARLALARLQDEALPAVSVRIDAESGDRTERGWLAHPECGCRGIAHLVGAGSATSRQTGTGSPAVAPIGPAGG